MANLGARPSQHLALSMRQELQLLPSMLQSIEILQLGTSDLAAYLENAAEENVALRVDAPSSFRRTDAEASERHAAWVASQPDRGPGLVEALEDQLTWMEVPETLDPWVRHVIRSLEESGVLGSSDETLLGEAHASGLDGDLGHLGRAIAIVQAMEPKGIGGRDTVETLLLQLDPRHPDYELLAQLVETHLDDLARNKLPRVARGLGVEIERLHELVCELRGLELAPGAGFCERDEPALIPDLHIEEGARGWEVRLEEGGLHAVAIDEDVAVLAREKALDRDVKELLKKRVEEARWIVDAVEQRRRTLLRVARATFARQDGFLEHGPEALKPLRMTELSETLEIHLSTVSRAVAGKHVATPFGLFPLRWFFQGAGGGDESLARNSVRDAVSALVEDEDPANPLSDEDLAAKLAEDGLKVARRTVAKYRRELGIPSSYQRRRYD